MTSPFATERQLFSKLTKIDTVIESLRIELARRTLEKAEKINIPLRGDLADKCEQYLHTGGKKNCHECKQCGKIFNDGRKLGGHVSRSHRGEGGQDQHNRYRQNHIQKYQPQVQPEPASKRRLPIKSLKSLAEKQKIESVSLFRQEEAVFEENEEY